MVPLAGLATSRVHSLRAATLLTWEDHRLNNPGGHRSGCACECPNSPRRPPSTAQQPRTRPRIRAAVRDSIHQRVVCSVANGC